MRSKNIILGILGVLIIIGVLSGIWFFSTYNELVSAQESVDSQWAQVDNQYQRRADLIPNLVATVKGYASQEEKIFLEVTKYRSQWGSARTQDEKIEAARGMDSALSRFMVMVENYPQLKSNENFLALQAQLEGTENRISVERMRYNEKVRDYNAMIKKMPASFVADSYGLTQKSYFEAQQGAQEVPQVKFGDEGKTAVPTISAAASAGTPVATAAVTSPPSGSVDLHAEKTDVEVGEDIILRLSAVNFITKPVMTVQVILIPSSGMSVTSADFVTSGAGQYTSTYRLEPGAAKDVEVRINTNQVGDFEVKGTVVFYFGEDKSTAEYKTLTLPIKVRPVKNINK